MLQFGKAYAVRTKKKWKAEADRAGPAGLTTCFSVYFPSSEMSGDIITLR